MRRIADDRAGIERIRELIFRSTGDQKHANKIANEMWLQKWAAESEPQA